MLGKASHICDRPLLIVGIGGEGRMSLADDLKKLVASTGRERVESGDDGDVNSGDPVKVREYENKVRVIAGKMSDDELARAQKTYEKPDTRGQKIVKDELNKEQIRRGTTKR